MWADHCLPSFPQPELVGTFPGGLQSLSETTQGLQGQSLCEPFGDTFGSKLRPRINQGGGLLPPLWPSRPRSWAPRPARVSWEGRAESGSVASEREEAAARSVPGASPWASAEGVRGRRRSGWEGKGLDYRETGAGEGSRFTTKTDDGPRCFGSRSGVRRGGEEEPRPGKELATSGGVDAGPAPLFLCLPPV